MLHWFSLHQCTTIWPNCFLWKILVVSFFLAIKNNVMKIPCPNIGPLVDTVKLTLKKNEKKAFFPLWGNHRFHRAIQVMLMPGYCRVELWGGQMREGSMGILLTLNPQTSPHHLTTASFLLLPCPRTLPHLLHGWALEASTWTLSGLWLSRSHDQVLGWYSEQDCG